jgi:hypothetical protein
MRGRLLAELRARVDDPREAPVRAEPLRFEAVLRDEPVLREPLDAVFDLDSPLRALLLADFDELEPDLLDVLRFRLFPRALDFDFDLAFADRELLLLRLFRPELDGILILLHYLLRCFAECSRMPATPFIIR